TTSDNPYIFVVSDAGTYQITALSDANCTGTDFSGTATVNINTLPEINLGNDTTITVNDTLLLDAGAGFVSYLWNDGSSEQTLLLEGSNLGAGNYEFWVKVEDNNTCENSDTINVNIENEVSVNLIKGQKIKIYPNPSKDIFFLEVDNSESILKICISDINGKIIQEIKPVSEPIKINLQNNPAGIYFVRIIRNTGNKYIKILKQD
ncbi:MAG: T9SS type A sorting domain-containing protein, partial [Bacteroidales bacterium]|nr:T9SS type A sorting domain-containing protein [Bacteroidales bacterium]